MAYLGQSERYTGGMVNQQTGQVQDPILGKPVPAWAYNHASVVPRRRQVEAECQGSTEPPPDRYVRYYDDRTGKIVRAQWKDVPEYLKKKLRGQEADACRNAKARYTQTINALIRSRTDEDESNRRAAEEAERRTRERVEEERRRAEEERREMERRVNEENRRRREENERRWKRGLAQAMEEARRAREEAEAKIARTRAMAEEEARRLRQELEKVRGLGIDEQARRMRAVEEEYARKRAMLEAQEKTLELQRKLAAQEEKQAAQAGQALDRGQPVQAAQLFGGIDPTVLLIGAAVAVGMPLLLNAFSR